MSSPTPRDEDRHIEGPRLRCHCRCSILNIDFDSYGDEHTWSWDFYTNASQPDASWPHRLRIIWNLLRGKDHYFHGTVHTVKDMRLLLAFLHQTMPAPPVAVAWQPAITTTGGYGIYTPPQSDAQEPG